MLVIYSFADVKMLSILTLLIKTITCFLDRPSIVMFNQGLTLSLLLIILWIPLIFFSRRLGKSVLSYRMSKMLELVAWAYDFLTLELVVFLDLLLLLKNLDLFKTSLGGYAGMGSESLAISTSLLFRSFENLLMEGFSLNLLATAFLKEMFWLLIEMEFQLAL